MSRRLFIAALAATHLAACRGTPHAQAAAPTHPDEAHDHEAHDHEAHETARKSDLDRPIDELIAARCEHGVNTFECDECRYEVGFVRAPAAFVEEGLFTIVPIELRRIAAPIPLTGEVRFDERRVAHISAQLEGLLRKVHVALGDTVRKGQPLVEIESVLAGEGQATYLEAQGLLTLARRSFERISELRRESIASEKEFLQAKHELDAAEIRASAARERLARLGASRTGGGRVTLRAPMDGTVLTMHAVPGELAKAEESLLTVGDSTAVWVWADLYERDLASVKRAQRDGKLDASIQVKAYPGEFFPGTVDLVSPAMDPSSRTVKMRIQVPNADGRLLAGMFAQVAILLPGTEEALAVPKDAVLEDEGRAFVFVHYQGDDYVRRPVVTGRAWGDWIELVEGLAPSQRVVDEGAFLMKSDTLRSKMGAGCAD